MKSRGLTFLDDEKSCEGCIVKRYKPKHNTVCPLKHFMDKYNLVNECPCIECVIKPTCNTICGEFKLFVRALANHDIFNSDLKLFFELDIKCKIPKRVLI